MLFSGLDLECLELLAVCDHLQKRFLPERCINWLVIGTTAASGQAAIGNVIAPSLFATMTSAGAGGYGVAAISGAVQWVGGTMMGLAALAGAAGTWLYGNGTNVS